MTEMSRAHLKSDHSEIGTLGAPRFSLVRFNDVRLDIAPNNLIKVTILSESIVVVWGPPKCGKSCRIFDLIVARDARMLRR